MNNDQAYDEGYRAGMQRVHDSGHKIFMALARENDDIKGKLEEVKAFIDRRIKFAKQTIELAGRQEKRDDELKIKKIEGFRISILSEVLEEMQMVIKGGGND